MNTTSAKKLNKRRTAKTFRQAMKQSTHLFSKISGRMIGRAFWGTGMAKKDLPKEEE
jgi:hypothetical protein